MKSLRIYAGPAARRLLETRGPRPESVRVVPGAAGGPKGLILGPLDEYLFGTWLASTDHPVHLVGASIGAWRMATGCLDDPAAAFARLSHDYIHQDYVIEPGRKRPTAQHVSESFGASLDAFYGGRIGEVLSNSRYKLHILTSRGRHLLSREHKIGTPVGYLGAFLTNTLHRRAMGAWLERVVFSAQGAQLPFATRDYATRQVTLTEDNFKPALQASCSIPFVLQAVADISGAPSGAYWDGGITDYHLHLDWREPGEGLVLYPHFQKAVVPGWLDKGLKWRHKSTPFLESTVVLAPDPEWVKTLPNGKLPDRTDFTRYGTDLASRVKAWEQAVGESRRLADEFEEWVARPDMSRVEAL